MRPLPTVILFLLLLALRAAGQMMPETAAGNLLAGPVKSMDHTVTGHRMTDEKVTAGETRTLRSLRFDRAGNVAESLSYDHRGVLIGRNVSTFDASGVPTGYRSYSATGRTPELSHVQDYVFKCDSAAGRVSEYIVSEAGGSQILRNTYKYDPSGNLVEEEWYTHLGVLGGKTIYGHEPARRRRTRTHYHATGEQLWKVIEDLNSQEKIVWQQRYRGTKLKFEVRTTYDPKGRPLEEVTTEFNVDPNLFVSHSPRPGRLSYRYDDENNISELSRFDSLGQLKSREVRRLDARGNEIEMAEYGPGGIETPLVLQFYDDISKPGSPYRGTLSGRRITQFEYDRFGNWTRKKQFVRTSDHAPPTLYSDEQRKFSYF